MNPNVQRFLDSLVTDGQIVRAFDAVVGSSPSECAHHLASYARSQSHYFSPDEATSWLNSFRDSINDSLLRTRFHRMRLRECNDWAAFLALEREIKVYVPDEQLLGNPWGLVDCDDKQHGRDISRGIFHRLAVLLRLR